VPEAVEHRLMTQLYRVADKLASRAEFACLDSDFGSMMIQYVNDFLTKTAFPYISEADYTAEAVQRLKQFWGMSAQRRRYRKEWVSLDMLDADVWLQDPVNCDPLAILLANEGLCHADVVLALRRLGFTEAMAWAWTWRIGDEESWNEIAQMLKRYLGYSVTEAQIRQWSSRYFGRSVLIEGLSRLLSGEDVPPVFRFRSRRSAATEGMPHNNRATKIL
jgi:hypothetical protein